MSLHTGRSLILAAVCVLAGCDPLEDMGFGPEMTTEVRVAGRVVSQDQGAAIANAKVRFGAGGNFSWPEVRDSVVTDRDGRFAFAPRTVKHAKNYCGYWVQAGAAGYQPSTTYIRCIGDPQTVEVVLRGANP